MIETNSAIKENLKVWLSGKKMINDTVDILDAKIVNFGINFSILADRSANRFDVLEQAIQALVDRFGEITYDIGEPVFVTDIYNVLNDVEGVVDTVDVKLVQKIGGVYSDLDFSFDVNMSNDGRFIKVPKNFIMELKFPSVDIKGVVK